jgi:hypothetical protein
LLGVAKFESEKDHFSTPLVNGSAEPDLHALKALGDDISSKKQRTPRGNRLEGSEK